MRQVKVSIILSTIGSCSRTLKSCGGSWTSDLGCPCLKEKRAGWWLSSCSVCKHNLVCVVLVCVTFGWVILNECCVHLGWIKEALTVCLDRHGSENATGRKPALRMSFMLWEQLKAEQDNGYLCVAPVKAKLWLYWVFYCTCRKQ